MGERKRQVSGLSLQVLFQDSNCCVIHILVFTCLPCVPAILLNSLKVLPSSPLHVSLSKQQKHKQAEGRCETATWVGQFPVIPDSCTLEGESEVQSNSWEFPLHISTADNIFHSLSLHFPARSTPCSQNSVSVSLPRATCCPSAPDHTCRRSATLCTGW